MQLQQDNQIADDVVTIESLMPEVVFFHKSLQGSYKSSIDPEQIDETTSETYNPTPEVNP